MKKMIFTLAAALPLTAAIAAAGIPASAAAAAGVSVGDVVGTSEDAVRAKLEELGNTVREIETEDGEIEAEITMNGASVEIGIDAATGKVLEIEMDEAEDDEDEDED